MHKQMLSVVLATAMVLVARTIPAADPAAGKKVFDHYCSECHAPGFGHSGTQELEVLRGKDQSVLERRRDLAPDYVRYVVRHGLWQMPPYRPTEIDDHQLDLLVAYLAKAK